MTTMAFGLGKPSPGQSENKNDKKKRTEDASSLLLRSVGNSVTSKKSYKIDVTFTQKMFV